MIFSDSFMSAFERVIGHEGGFQNNKNDRGNWTSGKIGVGELKGTKFGIAAMMYPTLDIKNLTLNKAREIYYKDYWLPLKCDQIDSELAYQLFDSTVNHGQGNAVKFLQRALRVSDDGILGPVTLSKVKAYDKKELIVLFNIERVRFVTNISTFNTFGAGWMRRVMDNLEKAIRGN